MMVCVKKYFPKEIEYICPEGGMFLWLVLPGNLNANLILDKALMQKVGFVPGGPFFPEGNNENTIRLNFSTSLKENIEPGIKILGSVLKEEIGSV
jgi:2-aminoadipate transaminase